MTKYANGKIYKMLNTIDDNVYIGSTIQPLSKRMWRHKEDAKRQGKCKVHQHMNNIGHECFCIELIELCPCNSREGLLAKEGEWIRKIGTLNSRIAGRSKTQHRADNIDKINEYDRTRYKDNETRQSECKTRTKQWTIDNKEHAKEYNKEWRENNKEYKSQKDKQYREDHKEQMRDKQKKWREENRERVK